MVFPHFLLLVFFSKILFPMPAPTEAREFKLSYQPPTKSGDPPSLVGEIRIGRVRPIPARIELLRAIPGLPTPFVIDNLPFETAVDPNDEEPDKPGVPKLGKYLHLDLTSRVDRLTFLADPRTIQARIHDMRLTAHEFMIRWQVGEKTATEAARLRDESIRSVALTEQVRKLQTEADKLRLERDARSPRVLAQVAVRALVLFLRDKRFSQYLPHILGLKPQAPQNEQMVDTTLLGLGEEANNTMDASYRQALLYCRTGIDKLYGKTGH